MSNYEVGGYATLRAAFRVGDVLTDPSAVTLRIRPPTGGEIGPFAPDRDDEGLYSHSLQLTQAGVWRWVFTGTGDAAGVQSGSLRVAGGYDQPLGVADYVTIDEIETALHRDLTDAEADRVPQLVGQLVSTLELVLNRDLVGRTYTAERSVIAASGLLVPLHGPVASVAEAVADGYPVDAYYLGAWDQPVWWPGMTVELTYTTSGTDSEALRGVVVDAVARTVLAGPQAGSGSIKSYSVEGTSITYGDVSGGGDGGKGRVTVGELRGIGRLRRPVLL